MYIFGTREGEAPRSEELGKKMERERKRDRECVSGGEEDEPKRQSDM
jgi:hypothetical protein